jgi:hypothetical protein
MDLRAQLLSIHVRDLQDEDLVGLSSPLSEPKFASLLLCVLSLSPSPCSLWPGPPFILKGIPQWPNCMCDRCHSTLGGGVALQG